MLTLVTNCVTLLLRHFVLLLRHFLKINVITSLRVFICVRDNDVMDCVGREHAWSRGEGTPRIYRTKSTRRPRGAPSPRALRGNVRILTA